MGKAFLIGRFEQPRAKAAVNFYGTPYYFVGQLIKLHFVTTKNTKIEKKMKHLVRKNVVMN